MGGKTNLFSATLTPGNLAYVGIWIDLNRNYTFEPSEYTYIGSGNGITVSKNVFIPSLPSGVLRLRVRRAAGPIPVSQASFCTTNYPAGEIEDYSVTITQPPVVIYFTSFTDTLYDPVVNLTARITQSSSGLDTTPINKPRIWYKSQGGTQWKTSQGTLISGTVNDGNWRFPVYHDSLNFRRNSCDSVQYYFVAQDVATPINLGYLPEPALHTDVNTRKFIWI
jgi:GEVED domain